MNFFASNIKLLRERKGLKQSEMLEYTGIANKNLSNYENAKTEPPIESMIALSNFFSIDLDILIKTDLGNVQVIPKNPESKIDKKVQVIVPPTVQVNAPKEYNQQDLKISIVAEPGVDYIKTTAIPITDIAVAAGTSGVYNGEYIEHLDSIKLPANLTKKNATYLAVKIKGHSMSPTFQDSGYAIIRLLNKSEWASMRDERVYVVSDTSGQTYLKRVKNRFKQGFIVLMSDNPDKASFPNFNLESGEINTIWYVEWYLSAKMPNIHDQFYSRLQQLEDKVDLLFSKPRKM